MSARNNRILHIDGDSFFASCGIALDPKLEGRPVWVGGGRRGDGIVIAANRQAKKYGIKTGTACFEAKRLCPNGVLCRPHYDGAVGKSELAGAINPTAITAIAVRFEGLPVQFGTCAVQFAIMRIQEAAFPIVFPTLRVQFGH